MKAIILSAGYGTRLRPLTDTVPKPLVPILDTPMLSHIIMNLKNQNVSGIGINIHHKVKVMEEYLNRNHKEDNITFSYENEILGVAGGIGGFRDYLKGEDIFIVHNGDILSNISLNGLMPKQNGNLPLCTMVLHDSALYNNVSVDRNNNVIDLRGVLIPADIDRSLAYTGISIMSSDILRLIPEGESDLVPFLLEMIKKERGLVKAAVVDGCSWMDVGTINNYFSAHREILVNKKPLIEKKRVPETACFIGEDVLIGEDVSFSGYVSAGKGVVFKSGCRVENCILWDRAVIEERAVIKNSIIGEGWIVNGDQ